LQTKPKQELQKGEFVCLCSSERGYKNRKLLWQGVCTEGPGSRHHPLRVAQRRWSRAARSGGSSRQASSSAAVPHAALVHADKPASTQLRGNTDCFSGESKQLNARGVSLHQAAFSL